MDRHPQPLLLEALGRGETPPGPGEVADTLLLLAMTHDGISREEAGRLTEWDIGTVVEYLTLRLNELGVVAAEDVFEMVGFPQARNH